MDKRHTLKVLVAPVLATLTLGRALAAGGNLPGGTSIEVTIDNPSNGREFTLPPGQTTVDVDIVGTASIGEGITTTQSTLIYVLDTSGSTEGSAGVNCPDQNPIDSDPGDPVPDEDEIIDCEIAAAINLNDIAVTLGLINETAMIAFASNGVTADATPGGSDDPMIAPDADANANGINDVNEVLQSIRVADMYPQRSGFVEFAVKNLGGAATDYADAIRETLDVAESTTNTNITVIFISDGKPNSGDRVSTVLPAALPGDKTVVFHTFSIPSAYSTANCSTNTFRGSLQDIADLTGGTCTEVPDPSTLPDVLPVPIIPTLDSLQLAVDGGPPTDIDNVDIDPDLPRGGPTNVTFDTTVFGLGVGDHEICVTASGTDSGGSGNAVGCVTIRVISCSFADLAIEKSDSPDPVKAGNHLTYTLKVINNGPADATNVVLTDTLPPSLTFDPTLSSTRCTEASGIVTCSWNALANTTNTAATITVVIDSSTADATVLTNTATVTADELDPDPSNNTATEDTRVSGGWRDVCVPQQMQVTGIGMGDRYHTLDPQSLLLADPASANWLLAQVAGRYHGDAPTPERVTFTTDAPQSITLNEPSSSLIGYTFETILQPAGHITVSVSNPGDSYRTPRGLILYGKRAVPSLWTSVGKTTSKYVYHNSHTEMLTFPPLEKSTNLFLTAVVIDNDDDSRPLVLEATAGGVTASVTENGPTDGAGLNLVNLTLSQVPTATDQISITLESPSSNGDSLALVGLNVSHLCPDPVPTLHGSVDMQGRPTKPAPTWAIPLTVWLTPARASVPTHMFTTTTDQNGEFELNLSGIIPGAYGIQVKGNHTLGNVAPDVRLIPGDTPYFFGPLLEGDIETVTTFNAVQQADADALISAFNRCQDNPGFVANADLDESGCVLLPDFGLLSGNFGTEGNVAITPSATLPIEPRPADRGGALMAFDVEEAVVPVGEIVTLTLDIDPRDQPVNGAMVHLRFDPTLVEVMKVTPGDYLPYVLEEPSVDDRHGVVRFAVGFLGRAATERFSVAALSVSLKADTAGTTITLADAFPATDVSGPGGSILAETKGITLRAETQGVADSATYLPIVTK